MSIHKLTVDATKTHSVSSEINIFLLDVSLSLRLRLQIDAVSIFDFVVVVVVVSDGIRLGRGTESDLNEVVPIDLVIEEAVIVEQFLRDGKSELSV